MRSGRLLFALILLSIIPFFVPSYWSIFVFNPVFTVLALSVARFASAVGAFSLYLNLAIHYIRTISPSLKRRKGRAVSLRKSILWGGLGYFSVLFLYYTFTSIYLRSLDFFNIVAGLVLTMINTLLIPVILDEKILESESAVRNLLMKANYLALGIKRVYYERLVRDYGLAIATDLLILKLKMDLVKNRLLKYTFPLMVVATFPLLPVFVVGLYLINHLYVAKKSLTEEIKGGLVFLIVSLTAYVVAISILFPSEVEFYAYNIPYIFGLLVSLYFYFKNMAR